MHAIEQVAKQDGRVGDHVIRRTSLIQKQWMLDEGVADAEQALDLRIGEPTGLLLVSALEEGVHGRNDEMMAVILAHRALSTASGNNGGRLVLLKQGEGRQDHVAAAQLVFICHDGRAGGGHLPASIVIALGAVSSFTSHELLGHPLETGVGLIAATADGTRQGIERAAEGRGFVVDEDGRRTLDPHLVHGVGRHVRGVGRRAVLGHGVATTAIATAAAARLLRSREGWDGIVNVGQSRLGRVVDHVGPGIVEGDGGQEGLDAGDVVHLRQVGETNAPVLEVPDHVAAVRAEHPVEEVGPGHVVHAAGVDGLLDALPQAHDGGVGQLEGQRDLVVGQGPEGDLGEPRGVEGGHVEAGEDAAGVDRRHGQAPGVLLVGRDGREPEQIVDAQGVVRSEAVAVDAGLGEEGQMLLDRLGQTAPAAVGIGVGAGGGLLGVGPRPPRGGLGGGGGGGGGGLAHTSHAHHASAHTIALGLHLLLQTLLLILELLELEELLLDGVGSRSEGRRWGAYAHVADAADTANSANADAAATAAHGGVRRKLLARPDLGHLLLELLLQLELALQLGHVVDHAPAPDASSGSEASQPGAAQAAVESAPDAHHAHTSTAHTAHTAASAGSATELPGMELGQVGLGLVLDRQGLRRLPGGPGLAGHRPAALGGTVHAPQEGEVDAVQAGQLVLLQVLGRAVAAGAVAVALGLAGPAPVARRAQALGARRLPGRQGAARIRHGFTACLAGWLAGWSLWVGCSVGIQVRLQGWILCVYAIMCQCVLRSPWRNVALELLSEPSRFEKLNQTMARDRCITCIIPPGRAFPNTVLLR